MPLSDYPHVLLAHGGGGGIAGNYGPILYLEPKTPGNVAAIGFDMFSEATRHAAMQAALETGEASLSGPVHLIQDSGSPGISLLLYLPVYRGGDRPTTVEARHAAMLGWVYVPFRMRIFMENVLTTLRPRLSLRVVDVTDGGRSLQRLGERRQGLLEGVQHERREARPLLHPGGREVAVAVERL